MGLRHLLPLRLAHSSSSLPPISITVIELVDQAWRFLTIGSHRRRFGEQYEKENRKPRSERIQGSGCRPHCGLRVRIHHLGLRRACGRIGGLFGAALRWTFSCLEPLGTGRGSKPVTCGRCSCARLLQDKKVRRRPFARGFGMSIQYDHQHDVGNEVRVAFFLRSVYLVPLSRSLSFAEQPTLRLGT